MSIPTSVIMEGQNFENPSDCFIAEAQITSKIPATIRAIQRTEIFLYFQKF